MGIFSSSNSVSKSTYPILTLKAGREASTGFHHPWIFSGAIQTPLSSIAHGSLVHVADKNGKILGTGTFSAHSSISVRVLDFKETEINQEWITEHLQQAQSKRDLLDYGPTTDTTGYRLVYSEEDNFPGLIIDRYEDTFVLQISTAGMENLKPLIIKAVTSLFSPRAIIEKSEGEFRKREQLSDISAIATGEIQEPIAFTEHGLHLTSYPLTGQKTGFFLDQKVLRQRIKELAKDKKVLNLFSYTGASSFAALAGGAASVHNVDSSKQSLDAGEAQAKALDINDNIFTSEEADIFTWLNDHQEPIYDMVIMDPPALMKSKTDKERAMKAYHFLNRSAMRLVKQGGIFITSSCSHFLYEEDLAFTLRRASVQNNVNLSVIDIVRQAPDHPQSIYFPEGLYLKSFICQKG